MGGVEFQASKILSDGSLVAGARSCHQLKLALGSTAHDASRTGRRCFNSQMNWLLVLQPAHLADYGGVFLRTLVPAPGLKPERLW